MITYSLYQYDATKVAQSRLEAIKFFEEFGLKATKKTFKVSKTTLYRWKKALKDITFSFRDQAGFTMIPAMVGLKEKRRKN